MEEKSRYEEMYGKLVAYEQNIHLQNQKRIKIGLKCIAIIPPIFLILLFWTDSNKVVFLILWIRIIICTCNLSDPCRVCRL